MGPNVSFELTYFTPIQKKGQRGQGGHYTIGRKNWMWAHQKFTFRPTVGISY